jgi:ABC-type multidrug transport system fused ATPase/permease subunit
MIGQSISAAILLFIFELEIIDYVVLPIAIAIASYVIRKLQKLLTHRQQEYRNLDEKKTDLEQLKAINLQNGDIKSDEIFYFLIKSIDYDNQFVRPLYKYIGITLDITLDLVSLAYAFYLPNNRAFLAKLVLIRTISSALNSVTYFMSQYNRYCKHFEKKLEFDENYEQVPIAKEGLQIKSISIQIGQNYFIEGGQISIDKGTHKLVQGPSSSGKTSLVDALCGFIPGIILSQGVPANYSDKIWMHA